MASRVPSRGTGQSRLKVYGVVAAFLALLGIIANAGGVLALPALTILVIGSAVTAGALVLETATRLHARPRRPPWPWLSLCVVAVVYIGGLLGYLFGPVMAPAPSRDADIYGYCISFAHTDGSDPPKEPTLPRSPEGQFHCKGSTKPVNMEQACRWKWGPQAKPPTLANESDAYSWRCHPKYR